MTDIALDEDAVARFFHFARERQAIYLRRRAGLPRPWTNDSILDTYSFTNLFREYDKTTRYLKQAVRDKYAGTPEILLATVVFRWFNTIRTGEVLFGSPYLEDGRTPFERFLADPAHSYQHLDAPLRLSGPPWVTGAYMIRSPTGVDKLRGISELCSRFATGARPYPGLEGAPTLGWLELARELEQAAASSRPHELRHLWEWLREFYGQGDFLAYEVVTDMRHTYLLSEAPDIMTWANPGPGALRGAALALGRTGTDRKGRLKKGSYAESHAVMGALLHRSLDPKYWPQEDGGFLLQSGDYRSQIEDVTKEWRPGDWPKWEMREPEMWLCEFTKYERTRLGLGRPRGNYR